MLAQYTPWFIANTPPDADPEEDGSLEDEFSDEENEA
jgi:hypothetical protein